MSNHPNRNKAGRDIPRIPKPADIRKARADADLTLEQSATMVHAGLRSWQHWEEEGGEGSRSMPPASWELFHIKVNARRLLAKKQVTPELLRALGVYLPALD